MNDHRHRRVLVVVNASFDTAGGNLRAAVNVSEALAEFGDQVTFTAPWVRGDPHETVGALDPAVTRKLFPASRPLARFGASWRQFTWLLRSVRDFDQVQVHSLFHLSAVYTVAIAALQGVPVVLWPHGTLDPFDLRKHARIKRLLGSLATRRVLDCCAALVFTTEHESRVAVTYGATVPHEVVPLPVRPARSTEAQATAFRERYGVPADAPVVLFLGRVDYKKGLPLLVESVARVADCEPYLVIAGDGDAEQMRKLDDAVRANGLADRVRLTGWVEGELRSAAYAAADIFALLSDAENFGLALVEALSVGVPAVISDQVFIAADLADAGAARVVPRDARASATALAELLADRGTAAAIGARGSRYVQDHFSPSVIADQVRRLGEGQRNTGTDAPPG